MRISYKYLGRYKEIASVMMSYGFGYIVEKFNKDSVATKMMTHSPKNDIKKLSSAQRLRMAFEELGPTYIKIGQILSTRKDILDDDMIIELSKLRDNVERFPNEVAMNILENELECPKEDIFKYISPNPIAAASIAQVYEAELLDGKKVVIKIQRPGIENIIKADITILKRLASGLANFNDELNINAEDLISEIEVQLLRELDFKFESVNGNKLKNIFKNEKNVIIPYIYDQYTSKKIIVMEKIEGICLSDIDNTFVDESDKKTIVDIGVQAFFKQVMTCGFFHADPHPGNLFIVRENGLKLAFIDFGMIGIIDSKTLTILNQLIIASTDKNIDKIVRILVEMDAIGTEVNKEALKRDILYLMHYYYDLPFEELSISEIINEVFRFMRTHKVKLPRQLVTLGKTVITLEGTSRGLYKNFSVEEIASAYLKYYKEEKLDIRKNFAKAKSNIDEYYFELISVPNQLKSILTILEKNNLKLDIGEMRSPKLEDNIKKFTTQVSMSIMLAACIVGSSLILSSNNIQKYRLIKYMGISGFILSFIIGITLVFMILKNNYRGKK
ncbi:ABC1 kinase family protein [Peptostreptococcus equinus]|uniref:AarF/UbiB family protein n=1 Tax=Peptostreptococcus equinus TaxID=3003601 RepID=A0ABY7JRT4_9FIRM|nr:AarF/UbiB family protein [Peptostreptococcus sp. CBA3647]WAW15561.1 AarF/UbiB family protein [Peptostreptococcus sp. CBA3647]